MGARPSSPALHRARVRAVGDARTDRAAGRLSPRADGRLDRDAVEAVLAAAGHHIARRSRELPAGLTQRELEVLLALVVGQSNQGIADSLGISAKTVGHHVQHVYQK